MFPPAWAIGGRSSAYVFKAWAIGDTSSAHVFKAWAIGGSSSAHVLKEWAIGDSSSAHVLKGWAIDDRWASSRAAYYDKYKHVRELRQRKQRHICCIYVHECDIGGGSVLNLPFWPLGRQQYRPVYRPVYIHIYIYSHTAKQEVAHTTRRARTHRNTKHQTPSMPTTRGSSSSGVSAGAISGSEQQADPVMDVDPPTNEPIDVDEDMSQTWWCWKRGASPSPVIMEFVWSELCS